MILKKLVPKRKPPCAECPYTLGQVHTLVNPCPECRANGYQTYERFRNMPPGTRRDSDGREGGGA